jgi:hypothetical protein
LSNNYGPFHFPEKLIPLAILNAIEGKPLPVYYRGENVRDWLHVEDHARALELIVSKGRIGYNAVRAERTNLQVVEAIRDPSTSDCRPRRIAPLVITFVEDRPATTAAMPLIPLRSSASSAGSRGELESGPPKPSTGSLPMQVARSAKPTWRQWLEYQREDPADGREGRSRAACWRESMPSRTSSWFPRATWN